MLTDVFELCKTIPAYEVAQREGLNVYKRGQRYWAVCPFHVDHTPSLCFFPDNGWKCFSCGAGGDAVAFLAQLKQVPPLVAATQLIGNQPIHCISRPRVEEREKLRKMERWREQKRLDLLDIQQDTTITMRNRVEVVGYTDALMDDESFTTALSAYWWSRNSLELLERLTPESLYRGELII